MENTKKTGKRNKKKNWTKESIEALLDFYAARTDEFQLTAKKTGYEHLLEDMLSAGYADSDTTSSQLEIKIQTLVRAYKYAIDNNNRTGAAPCVAPFMEKMDELFGSKPILTYVHNVMEQPQLETQVKLQRIILPNHQMKTLMPSATATDDVPSTSTASASKKRK